MQCLQIKMFTISIMMSLFDKVYYWMVRYDRKDLLPHNLKVVGSNPTPATNDIAKAVSSEAAFCIFGIVS